MFQFNSNSFADFFAGDKSSISTQIRYCDFLPFFRNGTVFTAESFIVNADFALGIATDKVVFLT